LLPLELSCLDRSPPALVSFRLTGGQVPCRVEQVAQRRKAFIRRAGTVERDLLRNAPIEDLVHVHAGSFYLSRSHWRRPDHTSPLRPGSNSSKGTLVFIISIAGALPAMAESAVPAALACVSHRR
jgi:hypothetical protein